MKARKTLSFVLVTAILLSFLAAATAVTEQDAITAPLPGAQTETLPNAQGDTSPDSEFLDIDDEDELDGKTEDDPDGEEEDETPPPDFVPEWEDFTDVSGHWAEDFLKKGFENSLLTGFEDATMRPDTYISLAQMVTILTRVLGATQAADISGTGISPDAWYYDAAALAYNLGLINVVPSGGFDGFMARQDAFAMLAKAFALVPARPDMTVLHAFTDSAGLKAENFAPVAALVMEGIVEGSDGALDVNGNIKRAEFLAVLYRVAENYLPAQSLTGTQNGGTVIQGGGALENLTADKLWFDCASESVSLQNVNAEAIILKSHALTSFSTSGGKTDTLVIDCGSANVELGDLENTSIDTVRLQSGGNLKVTDSVIKDIEITGSGQSVVIGGKHERLIVSGSGNDVTLLDGTEFDELIVTGRGNNIEAETDADVSIGRMEVSGDVNTIIVAGASAVDAMVISGFGGWINAEFSQIASITVAGNDNTLYLEQHEQPEEAETLSASLYIDKLNITGVGNVLSIGGVVDELTVDGRNNRISGSGSAKTLTLNAAGCIISLSVDNFIDNSKDFDVDRILALVSYVYRGNYTLEWAEENDYEDYEKEIWVNAKGYTSKTNYLIWINLAMQRVNIFEGSQGNWTLIRSCIVGSGAPGMGTPVGVYYTTYKQAAGWNTATYTCKPVVGFKVNTGYAFHSRLYYPGTTTIKDPSIGYPVSHGCIRMYDEDINFIYDSIPLNTTVVVY